MRPTLLILFIIFVTYINAQFPMGGNQKPKLKGKIEGIVLDSVTHQPVSFATVTLKKHGSSILQDGVLSDDEGRFKFDDINVGNYDIYISFLGYLEKSQNVETTLKNPDADMGTIFLAQSTVILDAIEIKEDKALIENKADRLVFNAENDASISGGDATDVLRKVPMLSVDLNGNVSIRGSQNIKILINGKPSGMFSSNVADALKMFPADQIKKVEVITSPSAKYDAEGSGGIINIITKKENIDGIAGSVNASVGNRQNSLFTNLNAGKGRFGLSSGGSLFYSTPADGILTFSRIDTISSGIRSFSQSGNQTTSRLGGSGSVSAFYDFNGYNSINSAFTFRGFGFDVDGSTSVTLVDPNDIFNDTYARKNIGDNFFGGFDWNTDYTHKFEGKEGQELSLSVQYSKQNNNQDYVIQEVHEVLSVFDRNANLFNEGVNLETTIQSDYTHPFSKRIKMEIGAKSVFRNIISDYNTQIPSLEGFTEQNETFNYGQDVYAGYGSFTFTLPSSYSIIAGLRYEQTKIDGVFASDAASAFENSYSNYLPNFTLSKALKNFKTLKIGYSQRIQRPSLYYINPFNNSADFINRVVGNPNLEPEIVHQVELSYNFTFKGFTTFSSVFYKNTQGIIEQILSIDPLGLSVNTFKNIGKNNAVGLNTFISKSINVFTIRTGGNISTYDAEGIVSGVKTSRNSYEYNVFLNGEVKFSGTVKGDFFGFFRSPVRTIQGDNPSFSIFGFGIKKEFKNSSVGIRIIEPFRPNKYFDSNIYGPGFSQNSSFGIPFRSFGVSYSYKFGKVDFKERKSKVKNQDLKQGGEQQGGGNMGNGNQ